MIKIEENDLIKKGLIAYGITPIVDEPEKQKNAEIKSLTKLAQSPPNRLVDVVVNRYLKTKKDYR